MADESPVDGLQDLDAQWDAHRSRPDQARPQGTATLPLTDLGNAERLVRRHGPGLRYCHSWGRWLVWDGTRWKINGVAEVAQLAKETTRSIAEEAQAAADPKAFASILEHAIASESVRAQAAMVKLAANEKGVPIEVDQLDASPWLFNVLNGTVDLRTGQLHPHRREDLCTKRASVLFDAQALCPTWDKFVLQVMANRPHLVDFLRRALGYALTGVVTEQVLLFLHGDGSNGKSTLLKAVLDLVGDYGKQAASELLLDKGIESHPTEIAELVGVRFAVCTEVGENKTFDEVRVKQLTGGDKMKGRFMRQDFFEFDPTHKLFLASNPKPNVRGADFAIWRRILLVPFEVKFADKDKDPLLPQKLRAEFPGILNWLVRGCLEWQAGGLQPPTEVQAATAQYREEEDLLTPFLAERCVVATNLEAGASELYTEYLEWSRQNGDRYTFSQKRFGSRLGSKGFQQGRQSRGPGSGRAIWRGIGLRVRSSATEPSEATGPGPDTPGGGSFEETEGG